MMIPEPPKMRPIKKGKMIIYVKEEDFIQSNFYKNEQYNPISLNRSPLQTKLKKSIPIKKISTIL